MKYFLKFILSLLFLSLISCNRNIDKLRKEICLEQSLEANSEIERGNIYYPFSPSEVVDYHIFKKYGLISYIYNYPISRDSCFYTIMNRKIAAEFFPIDSLKKIIDSLEIKYQNDTDSLININEMNSIFFDGILDYDFENKLPELIIDKDSIDNHILFTIKKIDTAFTDSRFWLVIDSIGNVSNIEIHKHYSKPIDSVIISELKKTKWKPLLNNKKKPIRSRISYVFSAKK